MRRAFTLLRAIQGMLYHALEQDKQYQEFLHNQGYSDGIRQFKAFTFSNLQGQYTVADGQMTFRGPVKLEIRSADPYFIQLLLRHFDTGAACHLLRNELTVLDCRLDDRHVLGDCIDIQMLSPAVVYRTEDIKTVYFSPADPEFYSMIATNAARKWESVYGYPLPGSLTVEPLYSEKGFRKMVTRFKQTYITGWKGSFRLCGCAPMLDLLYQTGLGAKNSQGFGMFEVL